MPAGRRRAAPLLLGFDFFAVPSGNGFAEVGFVGQVTGQRGVVAEDYIFDIGLAGAHGLEVGPHVRLLLVPRDAAERQTLQSGFFGGLGIVLFVPFVDVLFAHGTGETGRVIAGTFIFAGLRIVRERELSDFKNSLGAAEAINFRRLGAEIQAEINGDLAVLEQRGVNIGHVAAIFPAENAAAGEHALGRLVQAEHEHHAADQVNEEVARDSSAVFFPAAPAREIFWRHIRIPRLVRRAALPRFPIDSFWGEIEGRRIFPRSGGIVAAERAFDHHQVTDGALRDQLLGFGAEDGTHTLRADLDDPARGFAGFDHFEAVRGRVRHRLFAVNVFSGVDGVDHDLLVPVVGNGGDQAIDFLIVADIFVAGGDGQIV